MTEPWILCVDDDERVLRGLELQLGFDYDVRTAPGGLEGLELLFDDDDCAVIISDMRMPEMNGAEFLKESRVLSPDSTRILLTGFSDVEDAITAINDGGIYRFLTKPCPPDSLLATVEEGIRQWELVRSEQVLLEQTLHGAANALVEALELAAPSVFPGVRRIEALSRHLAKELEVAPIWQIGLAGLLHRIGWISVPADLVEKHLAGTQLSSGESQMLTAASATSVRLISHIPRLGGVARIFEAMVGPSNVVDAAGIVSAASELVRHLDLGLSGVDALHKLEGRFASEIVAAISNWEGLRIAKQRHELTVYSVTEGMLIEEDVLSTSGSLLVRSGSETTTMIVERLRNFADTQGVQEPIHVSYVK